MAHSSSRPVTYFDFEVSLAAVFPPISRRFLLRTRGTTFADLHRAIQDACGWQDYHLYRFDDVTPSRLVGIAQSPVDIGDADDDTPPGEEVSIASWAGKYSPRACRYTYDFGDEWQHDVVMRGITEYQDDPMFRVLVGGEGAFPPEDAGGMRGFNRLLIFLETGEDPDGDDDVDLAAWLGDWKPDVDVEALAAKFDAARKPRAR